MELTNRLYSFNEDLTIYAKKPWTCESQVELLIEPEDGSLPTGLSDDFEYFLEVFIAKDIIPNLSHVEPSYTLEQWALKLILYAENDA
ncbi:hypothetical protein AAD001_17940 [Colwelliaceae bacterium 6471]